MTLIEKFYPVMKPWLFRLDAEMAHTLTVKMMVIAHKLGMLKSIGVSWLVERAAKGSPRAVAVSCPRIRGTDWR